LGEEHTDTLDSMNGLGALYRCEGNYIQAEPLLSKAAELRRRVLGAEHPNTLVSLSDLAKLYRRQGKFVEANALFTSVLAVRRRVLGPAHPDTVDAMASLAEVCLQQKQYVAAESLIREAVDNDKNMASGSWQPYRNQTLLGASLAAQSRYAESEPLLISGYQGMVERGAAIPSEDRVALTQAGERIVQLYDEWGKLDKAGEWRENLRTRPRAF
jgi:tetratricopeptide (TPR) repeat protein